MIDEDDDHDDDHDNTVAGPARNTLSCVHCGQGIVLNLPLPVSVSVDIMRRFSALHRYCDRQRVFLVEEAANE